MREERPIDPKPEQEVQVFGAAIARELGDGPGAARIAAQRLRLAALEHPQSRLQPLVRGRLAWLAAASGVIGAVALTAFLVGQASTFLDGGVEASAAREVGISAEPPRAFEPSRSTPDKAELQRSAVSQLGQEEIVDHLHVEGNARRVASEQRTLPESEAAAESSVSPRLVRAPHRTRVATGPEAAAGASEPVTSRLPRPEIDVLRSVRERNAQSVSRRDQSNLQEEERAWLDALSAGSARSVPDVDPVQNGTWRHYARQGQYDAAVKEASRQGFEQLAAEGTASDLLLLADAARLGGAVEHAKRVLTTLRARFASHPNAAVAAFTLGRMAQEFDHDDRRAIQWYRTYLRQEPEGRMAEGARARLLKAQLRVGKQAAARAAAREYLAHHPKGSSASVARSVLSK